MGNAGLGESVQWCAALPQAHQALGGLSVTVNPSLFTWDVITHCHSQRIQSEPAMGSSLLPGRNSSQAPREVQSASGLSSPNEWRRAGTGGTSVAPCGIGRSTRVTRTQSGCTNGWRARNPGSELKRGGANSTPPSPCKKASLVGGRANSTAHQELTLSE